MDIMITATFLEWGFYKYCITPGLLETVLYVWLMSLGRHARIWGSMARLCLAKRPASSRWGTADQ